MRPLLLEWSVLAGSLVLLVSALSISDLFWRIDRNLYDLGITLAARPAPPDIVIVAIDDESLAQIGRWPWPRAVHATLLNRLTEEGARAVGLDIILSEPDARDPGGDRALLAALRANGKVVLPVLMEGARDALRETRPLADFAASAAALGHIESEIDADGIVRSVYPTPVSAHSRNMPGVEITANLIDALRTQHAVTALTSAMRSAAGSRSSSVLKRTKRWCPGRAACCCGRS